MNIEKLKRDLEIELQRLSETQSSYRSWGSVQIISAAVRETDNNILLARPDSVTGQLSFEILKRDQQKEYNIIFRKRKKMKVILTTRQSNASRVTCEIPPILDDQAQLLGPSLRYLKDSDDHKALVKALNGRFAINTSEGTTICIGRNLEDAFIAAQLVEKTSKAFLEAQFIGGAKSINKLEAWVMHKFYMLKYSKQSTKNR